MRVIGAVQAQRAPFVMSAVAVGATLAVLPFGTRHLGPTTSVVPAILAAVTCFDIMSVWLLAADYRDSGDRRMLGMAIAYLWSLLLMGGYALAFPGVVSTHPPLAVTASVAPYLYVGWHAGFPTLLGAAWAPWRALAITDRAQLRRKVVIVATAVTLATALGVVVGCAAFAHHLPVLIHGFDTTRMVTLTAPIAIPLVMASLISCYRGVRTHTGPERWSFVAILVCLCDLTLTYSSRYRFSLGWYAGRTMTVLAAAVVLIAMLASFRQLKLTAERNAAFDHLTGLPNRRSAYQTLAAMVARAGRMDTSLAVVMFDLDHFKQINDTHGHAAGDGVLRAVADGIRTSVRDADMIARIGGEEFLVLLPDASESAAQVAAERLRTSLRGIELPIPGASVTASFGVAVLQPGDASAEVLIQRADHAMYSAKARGRDRVAMWVAATIAAPIDIQTTASEAAVA